MEASADGSHGRWALRFLCPKRSLLSPPSASPLRWLIGAPRVLPPFTVAATLRPLHGDHAAPDLPREADEIRGLLPRGFDIVGALLVGGEGSDADAARALELARSLRERLLGAVASHGMVGGCMDAASGEIRSVASESGGTDAVEGVEVVWEDEPRRLLWEKGCLLRSELPLKLPLYVPADEISGIEERFSSLLDSTVAKLRDPQAPPLPLPPPAAMQMQTLTLRGVPSARRAAPPPASSAHLAASGPCALRVPRSLRRRRPRSLRTSASLEQEVKEVAGSPAPSAGKSNQATRRDVRNIAIVAHVDHGKTTLVDSMLRQAKVFRDNQVVQERIMDSNDLERERGITILSKNTSITYKGTKINIIDTPGHSDFGGEVERVLNMVEGVLLVVDSVEGPMPQTRFVLKKALEFGHAVVVVVNKIDRPTARPEFVVNSTFELFIELNATDEQCDFQTVYASGIKGKAGLSPENLADDLGPLFEAILRCIPEPRIEKDGALQMLVSNTEYDEHKGRIAIGRLHAGELQRGMEVKVCTPDDACRVGKVSGLFVYQNFSRVPVESVSAGDICAVCGMNDIMIGETIADKITGTPLPTIKVEEPTVRMSFSINTSPFVGREGKYVTSRNLRDRLYRELERNLAMKVEDGETADTFLVSGRGTLHLTILIENMRREGYEFMIGPPKVIKKTVDGKLLEPYEIAAVEVPEEYMGSVVELLGKRRGQMVNMEASGPEGTTLLKYKIPTRGLIGLRNAILTASRGRAILNTIFDSYGSWAGDLSSRDQGSLVAFEDGSTTSYALLNAQERGLLFVQPGQDVYKGQIVGIHQRPGDLAINVCKKKAATNVRSNKETTVVLDEPLSYSLDDCIEFIQEDELVEVTPSSIRMCKNPKISKKK